MDLTKPLNRSSLPYRNGDYHDPPFSVTNWCVTEDRGFWVSKLEMGTQTGTHIDAPAHFLEGAVTLDHLDISNCIGPYFLVRLSELGDEADFDLMLNQYRAESILLLLSSSSNDPISTARLGSLLALGCKLWVVMGAIKVEGKDDLHLHRKLAQEGIYLVEDLDDSAADAIQPCGEIMALPLRMEGVSGSPCRVVVSMTKTDSSLTP